MPDSPNEDKIFQQLDTEKLKQEVKAEAVKEAQDALITKLTGNKPQFSWEERGKVKPDNYIELFDEFKKKTPTLTQEEIDARVEEKLKAKEEEETKKQEEKRKQEEQEVKAKRESFDQEWYDLVKQGKMPAPSKEVQERINKGETLTKEEILADEGLKARLELAQYAKGKGAKLAYYEDYSQQAGGSAPVLGTRPSAAQGEEKELKYEEVAKNRKRLFGF